MKCAKCQFENREGAKFCKKCGDKLELICLSCGHPYQPGSTFCDECGHDLREPIEPPPIDYSEPQSYTPKFLADKILTTRSSIEGERKLVTVFFADVVNYTSVSEKLDPEEVHQIMDGAFRILMDEIHKYEGTINQFTGDGVMALFGAPVAHEDHAQRACYAALAIQKAMGEYGDEIERDTGVEFRMRVGINSGPVIVGAIGDDLRMDYTAVGDTTNLGSRMESMARPGTILVSGNTHRLVRDFFEFESLGKIEVKGKKEPQEAFELIKAGEVETRIGASVAKGLTRFVGRKNSMAALLDAFDRTRSGSGQVVGLLGEAGVGKSRLLLEMRNMLPQDEYSYLEGRCLQYGGSMAYLPVLDILRSYFDIKEGDREFLIKKKMGAKILDLDEKLKNVIPPFQSLLSLKVDNEDFSRLEPKEKRERTFEALRNLMIRVSQEKPMVLTVEDLHWTDKTSEEFLDYLIGWLANTPIMLLLLYRPEYTHSWGSKSYYTKVGLDHLGTNSSSELIKAILEEGEVAPELRQLILNRAAGNPLFMEEFTHTLLENGSIERKDEKYVLSGKASDIQVPDTIQGIIAARLDRLEENLKRTMQVASVIGRDFAFRILQAITGMREELKSYLLNLQGLEFIYEKNLFPELEYIFKHALTQEVAYNSLLLKRRKEIHEKIARAIEKLYAERLEEFYEMLAYHYSKTENVSKACQYLKLSGDKALGNFSPSEAVQFYREAASLLRDQPDSRDNRRLRLEILQAMAYPLRPLGYPEGSVDFLEEGENLARDLGDRKAQAYFQTNIGVYYLNSGDPVKGRAYVERVIEGFELTEEVEIIVPTYELILSYSLEGAFLKSCQAAPKVIALMEQTHTEHKRFDRPANIYSILHGFYGQGLAATGNFAEGERFLGKGLSFARDIDNLISIAMIEMLYGSFYLLKGDSENQVKHFRSSIDYLEKSQMTFFLGIVWAWLGGAYLYSGQTDTALRYAEKGLEMHTDLRLPIFLGSIHFVLSEVHLDLGNLEKALVHAEQAVDLSEKNNERLFEAEARITLGRVIAPTDKVKFDEARELMVRGIGMLDQLGIRPTYAVGLLRLGKLYSDAGQWEKALENLKKAEGMFQEMGMDYWLGKTQEVLAAL
ncbi:MAG: AAA family ATPase [Deltaproteobacteria bacterium]|nr:AAA family ATPase [Deltaproteobacteria bacterium]MBW2344878.1 AAA family ATPase [Deltaproteobacteria bacterium]